MKLFRKLFVSYLLVAVLALLISGGFAGYMVWQAAAATQMGQLRAYGRDMAEYLQDRDWTPDDLRRVQSTANRLEAEDTAQIWLVDRQGLVRMASPTADPGLGHHITPEELQQVLAAKPTRLRPHRPGGQPMVAVPVLRNGQTVGAVMLAPALEAVQAARNDILRFTLIGSAVAAIVVAIISLYISRRIADPLNRVSAAVRQVAKGDFSSRVHWDSSDEVGQLAEAFNEMAVELDRLELARRELVANVSHELKGPLARIAGYLEAMNDGIGGPEGQRQHFGIVRREVGRLGRLVNDLLDFSRLEAGKLKVHPIPCDLAPHLIRAAEVFEAPARNAGVSLAVAVPERLSIVECEPERVEQAVANLLENAMAFTPAGGTVSLEAAEADGRLQVTVSDTGPGIPPEELASVWERFYKMDRARTPDRRGFGLGLTIVKQLVELQGGMVVATSQLGQGSSFGFSFPLAQAPGAGDEMDETGQGV
ncbi:MAG: sensor histidine kinase [Mycobacterium leprae]